MRSTTSSLLRFVLLIALMAFPALSSQANTEEGEEEEKHWSGAVALSGGHYSGTRNSYNGRLQVDVKRDAERDRVRLGIDALYGKSDGNTDVDAQRAFGDYRHNFTHRFFGYWNAEVGRDSVEEIRVRFSSTVGPGYRIWEQDDKSYLDGEIGIGYMHESFNDETDTRNNATLRAAYEYKDTMGPKQVLEVFHTTEFLLPVTEVEAFLVRSDVGLAVPLVLELKLALSFNVEYQNEPAASAEKWSTYSTFGVRYEF
jgi:putative salt-induced outer membrane protein YdiY